MGGSGDETQYAAESGGHPEASGLPRVGDVIAGKYRVDRIVGVGGMGVVLAATHLAIGEPVAIKMLLPKTRTQDHVERFLREARAAVRIKSEHIVRVSDVGQLDDESPYMIMEFLEGRDLSARLAENGPLEVREAIEYVLQAATGIAEAHALGIIHRDLKPSNLFLTRRADGAAFVKVLDFGISKTIEDKHTPALTQTRETFGSPAYMSPEQIRSAKNVDARTDVWSLGVILHELLTGRTPFQAETAGGLLSAIAADEPEHLRARRPELDERLEAVLLKCLAKKPEQRFQKVSDLAEALEPFHGPSSVVSIGRIKRLSTHPTAFEPSSGRQPISSTTAFAATDGPVTTGSPRVQRVSPVLAIAAITAIAAAFGLGWFAFVGRTEPHKTVAAPETSAPPVVSTSVAATAVTAEPVDSAAPAAPAASSAAAPAKPRRAGAPPRASATARSSASVTAPPPPPPAPTHVDPAAESH